MGWEKGAGSAVQPTSRPCSSYQEWPEGKPERSAAHPTHTLASRFPLPPQENRELSS